MKYYLKKDSLGFKAGTEVELRSGNLTTDNYQVFYKKTSGLSIIKIPLDELSDWIEERDGMWKPKEGEIWYAPNLVGLSKYKLSGWYGDSVDEQFFKNGLVCPTPELAIELADRMLETAKKFWEEKI